MRRDVGAILLILLGGAVMRISLTGAFINYVKPGMKPYLIASAAVLILLGVLAFIDSLRDKREVHDHDTESEHGQSDAGAPTQGASVGLQQEVVDSAEARDPMTQTGAIVADDAILDDGHGHGRMRSPWLLLLPVAAIFLVAPGPLGAYTASREGASVSQPRTGSEVTPLPPGDPVPLRLDEYAVRAVWDNGRTLEGRTVEMVGFATPTEDGSWLLTRLGLACCAADALATKVKPIGDVPTVPANTWVSVTGRYLPGGGTGTSDAVPWLQVDTMIRIPQPEDPYL